MGLVPAHAVDPDREMSQYIRERWGAADGAPTGPIYAITQTEDGYLWIGAEAGLFQFDGFQFRRITNDSATVTNVLGLEVDDAGALWVRLPGPTLLRYRDGSFEDATITLDMPFSNVTGMSRTRDGGLLIARLEDGAVAYRKGAFETLGTATPLARSPVISLAQGTATSGWEPATPGSTRCGVSGSSPWRVYPMRRSTAYCPWESATSGLGRTGGSRTGTAPSSSMSPYPKSCGESERWR